MLCCATIDPQATRCRLLDDRRPYSISCVCLEHEEVLQEGRQLRVFAVIQRVGVVFLAVGRHGEDRRVSDVGLHVDEGGTAEESDAMMVRSRMRFWMVRSIRIVLHHTTTAHKPPTNPAKVSKQVFIDKNARRLTVLRTATRSPAVAQIAARTELEISAAGSLRVIVGVARRLKVDVITDILKHDHEFVIIL